MSERSDVVRNCSLHDFQHYSVFFADSDAVQEPLRNGDELNSVFYHAILPMDHMDGRRAEKQMINIAGTAQYRAGSVLFSEKT